MTLDDGERSMLRHSAHHGGEGVMQAERPWLGRQRPFQMIDRARKIALCEGCTPGARERRRGIRILRESPKEQWLGSIRPVLIEVHLSEPDERRRVRRLQVQGS